MLDLLIDSLNNSFTSLWVLWSWISGYLVIWRLTFALGSFLGITISTSSSIEFLITAWILTVCVVWLFSYWSLSCWLRYFLNSIFNLLLWNFTLLFVEIELRDCCITLVGSIVNILTLADIVVSFIWEFREFLFFLLLLGLSLLFLLSFLFFLLNSVLFGFLDRFLEFFFTLPYCVTNENEIGKYQQENGDNKCNTGNNFNVELWCSIWEYKDQYDECWVECLICKNVSIH